MMERNAANPRSLRILIVAENISMRLSGETILPYHYLRRFLAEGHDVHVLCHSRVRSDLEQDLASDVLARVRFVPDASMQRWLHRASKYFPHRVADLIFNQLIQLVTQLRVRAMARDIIATHGIDVVFQPTPIAAKAVSFLYKLGRPVVIGPMSGGMDLPPAFREMDGWTTRLAIHASRAASAALHWLIPGKPAAAALIVANPRTRSALPKRVRGRIFYVMESAVELDRWQPQARTDQPGKPVSFIFCGRFVDWKGIRFLVEAFVALAWESNVHLHLVGDGELFQDIAARVRSAALDGRVTLHGRLSVERYVDLLRRCDVFVTPSLRECGGIAMMEAMAVALPVIGVNWGGAAQYAGNECAVLVEPSSERALIEGLSVAMRRLALDAEERLRLGLAGRERLETQGLCWDVTARRILGILQQTVDEASPDSAQPRPTFASVPEYLGAQS